MPRARRVTKSGKPLPPPRSARRRFALIAIVAIVALIFLGNQVSTILSKVGTSV